MTSTTSTHAAYATYAASFASNPISHFSDFTDPARFIWASGVEDTFVPQTRKQHRALDEYELMAHYTHWREDLALARSLGVQALRWGVPWYRVEPKRGEFDWGWTDEVIPHLVEDLKINPILDLMHYGCPFWLAGEFAHPDYPRYVADYAAAFAERYRDWVTWYTPLNEPDVNAWMCGQCGAWPPYLRGDDGYVKVLLQLARGIVHTSRALKAINPGNVLVHVDAASMHVGLTEEHQARAEYANARAHLCYDLLAGFVSEAHPLWRWLRECGADAGELAFFQTNAIPLDMLGLNFYPQWSTRGIFTNDGGQQVSRRIHRDGFNFEQLIRRYYERYRAPIMITETSARGHHGERSQWLAFSLATIKRLRTQGIPVIGYTWFPMFTMIDWRYRHGSRPIDRYRIELGLFRLNGKSSHPGRWEETRLANEFRRWVSNPERSVGSLRWSAPVVQGGQHFVDEQFERSQAGKASAVEYEVVHA